ncbi:MAG TPA: hypothetical protein VJ885_13920, partial [Thermoanaerobaculia bacterium]|nr:hypothetical protein [Thermoanaerobaculia bacterium]
MSIQDDRWIFNGVDATTGDYLVPPMTPAEVIARLRERPAEPVSRALMPGFDPRDLAESGWGVIFPRGPHGVSPEIREALRPLLDHRREQTGARFRELELRPGEDLDAFLTRHGRGPGPVHPDRMPYYLLLAGDPGEIPFGFQTRLDLQHAVGRLSFDTPEEYARYARGVVRSETAIPGRDPLLDLFGPRNPDDPATELSTDHLLTPLAARLDGAVSGWRVRLTAGEGATRRALGNILRGEGGRPSLLFTASHGVGY